MVNNQASLRVIKKTLKKVKFEVSFDPDDYPDEAIAELLILSGKADSLFRGYEKAKKSLDKRVEAIQDNCKHPECQREFIYNSFLDQKQRCSSCKKGQFQINLEKRNKRQV